VVGSRSGGRILVDALRAHGTERIFCVPGESYLAVLDALYETPEIELIVGRMEASTANMACAHGALTGRPGVCLVTRGPGATQASVAVHTARQGSIPMLLLVGQVPRAHRLREAFQEIDLDAMFAPVAKWAATVDDPARIDEFIARAVAVATSGRRGPVVLALPEDVLGAQVADATAPAPAPAADATAPPPAPSSEALERLAALLAAAERPLIIAGGGDWTADAAADTTALAETWDIPMLTAWRRQDHVDNGSPRFAGTLGLGADPGLTDRVARSDLLLVIGGRLDEPTTGGDAHVAAPHPAQTLVHVHPDPSVLGRVHAPALAIVAGSGTFAAAARTLAPPDPSRWARWSRDTVTEGTRARRAPDRPPTGAPAGGTLDAGALARGVAALSEQLGPEAIVANGAGNYALWVHRHWCFRRFGTQLAPVSGAMGYGVPAGIAARLVHRDDRPIIAFAGDGCFMMAAAELATAVRHETAVVFVVVDNGAYGTIRMHQERRHPGRPIATDLVNPDFVALARAHGIAGRRVADEHELVDAVTDGVASGRPALVHVPLDPEALTP
jgi:acetolactate synthase I/II/III large subunit